MLNFDNFDHRLTDEVVQVAKALTGQASINPEQIMVVGATCRDILHSALGLKFLLRSTKDIDIAISTPDWITYEKIVSTFTRIGSNGIRFDIAGIPVDVIPFGNVESPEGIVTPSSRRDGLIVFAFDDVFQNSIPLKLSNDRSVRIPHPAGFAALKMRAWIDRAPDGQYKDAGDLALAAYWFQNSEKVTNSLSSTHLDLLEESGYDYDLAATMVLGQQIRQTLSAQNRTDLAHRWDNIDKELLATNFNMRQGIAWPRSIARRIEFINALSTQL